MRPRAAEVVGPYGKTGRFPKFCRGGCPHPPVPEDFSLSVGAAISCPQAFPLEGGRWLAEGQTDEGDVLNARIPGKSPRAGLGPAPAAFIEQVSAFL